MEKLVNVTNLNVQITTINIIIGATNPNFSHINKLEIIKIYEKLSQIVDFVNRSNNPKLYLILGYNEGEEELF